MTGVAPLRGPRVLIGLLAALTCPTVARAQAAAATPPATPPAGPAAAAAPPEAPPDPAIEQAREAFVLGTALANQGQWPEALAAFERSAALRPHPVTTYNLAYSERALGHYTRAFKLFRRSLAEHEAQAQGSLPDDLLALLRGYLPEVERRLAHAMVRVPAADARLSVDGRPLEALPAPGAAPLFMAGTRDDRGQEPVPGAEFEVLLDPGEHLFVLSAPGTPDRVVTEAFAQGASRSIVLEAKSAAPAPGAPEPAPAVDLGVQTPEPDRTWVYVAYGVGGAGIIAGSIFGTLALTTKLDLDDHPGCPGDCPDADDDDIDAMKRNADIATVAFAVGGVGAAVGTILLLTTGPSEAAPADAGTAATVRPWVGLGTVGASGRF